MGSQAVRVIGVRIEKKKRNLKERKTQKKPPILTN